MAKKKSNMLASVMTDNGTNISAQLNSESHQNIGKNGEALHVDVPIEYDDLINKDEEIKRLCKENSEMTDKLASYIEEIAQLKNECEKYKDMNNTSLAKISEITSENEKLKTKITELTSHQNNKLSCDIEETKSYNQSTNVSYKYNPFTNNSFISRNGYSSWN